MIFRDRHEAGQMLAAALSHYKDKDVVVYALPRGGVVPAAEVARNLGAPLDLVIVRKIGHPEIPEYAIGAVTETGEPVWNEFEVEYTSQEWRDHHVELARREAARRRHRYQSRHTRPAAEGKIAIIIDDGLATGLTAIAAAREVRELGPRSIVVAVPVAPKDIPSELMGYIDALVVIHVPTERFEAVADFYEDFHQVSNEEVRQLLETYDFQQTLPLDLPAFNAVLTTIADYPVTAGHLADQSKWLRAPANVVSFFESIPRDTVFNSKSDLMQCAEVSEVLMEEETRQPDERLRSYDG